MTFTDGVTTFTYLGPDGLPEADSKPDKKLESSSSTTAGGLKRRQTSGKRFVDEIEMALDDDQYNDLLDLLDQPSASFDYQPDDIPGNMTAGDFPMQVDIDIPQRKEIVWAGKRINYVTVVISSVYYV